MPELNPRRKGGHSQGGMDEVLQGSLSAKARDKSSMYSEGVNMYKSGLPQKTIYIYMYIYIYILVISGGDWFGFKEVADGTRMGLGRVLWEAAQRPSSFQAQSHSHQNYSNMIIERINHSRFRFFSEKSSA